MSAHTPGPWSYNRDEGGIHGRVVTIAEGEIAEAFAEVVGEEQATANARLIAAAPDLLEALENVVRICEAVRFSVGLGKGQLERIERAKQIIKRAAAGTS